MSFVGFLTINSKLAKIPNLDAKDKSDLKDCAICMNETHEGKELSCGHIYHLTCLTYVSLKQHLGGQK